MSSVTLRYSAPPLPVAAAKLGRGEKRGAQCCRCECSFKTLRMKKGRGGNTASKQKFVCYINCLDIPSPLHLVGKR